MPARIGASWLLGFLLLLELLKLLTLLIDLLLLRLNMGMGGTLPAGAVERYHQLREWKGHDQTNHD